MDRHMKRAMISRSRYDWETHEATRRRNTEQIATIPTPQFPATGTARIGALITEARRLRDQALLDGVGDGACGLRTTRPLDNVIESAPAIAAEQQPAHSA